LLSLKRAERRREPAVIPRHAGVKNIAVRVIRHADDKTVGKAY
jgi:hypothetical protein